jgi:hypothetical protein
MGHFFVYSDSNKVIGLNNGGVMLVVRRDMMDSIYKETSSSIEKSTEFLGIKMIFYPSNYISQLDALRKYKTEYHYEKQIYEKIRPKLHSGHVNFRIKELVQKTTADSIRSVLDIFFCVGSKLTHEFIADGTVLRIAEKPSNVSKFFTGRTIGATLGSCNIKKITDIEVTEKQIMFFSGGDNFMSVTRERCYTRD